MPKQFDGTDCIFCTRLSSETGEHALPRWVVGVFGTAQGPYTTWVNGAPATDRTGGERKSSALPGAKLPMCRPHNNVLADRFEAPMVSIGRRILADTTTTLDTTDAAIFGVWSLKTLMMLAHPQARYSDGVERKDSWDVDERALRSWTVEGLDPPDAMTLWVSRRDDGAAASEDPVVVPLLTIVRDGRRRVCRVKQFGLADLAFTLLSHPGWAVSILGRRTAQR